MLPTMDQHTSPQNENVILRRALVYPEPKRRATKDINRCVLSLTRSKAAKPIAAHTGSALSTWFV